MFDCGSAPNVIFWIRSSDEFVGFRYVHERNSTNWRRYVHHPWNWRVREMFAPTSPLRFHDSQAC
jgi:hypothetical protein